VPEQIQSKLPLTDSFEAGYLEFNGGLPKSGAGRWPRSHPLAASLPIHGGAVFHCQHATALDRSLKPVLRHAAPLVEDAWQSRCPGEVAEPTEEQTTTALVLGERVVGATLERVPKESRPVVRESASRASRAPLSHPSDTL
jgi:hypothetical protein